MPKFQSCRLNGVATIALKYIDTYIDTYKHPAELRQYLKKNFFAVIDIAVRTFVPQILYNDETIITNWNSNNRLLTSRLFVYRVIDWMVEFKEYDTQHFFHLSIEDGCHPQLELILSFA